VAVRLLVAEDWKLVFVQNLTSPSVCGLPGLSLQAVLSNTDLEKLVDTNDEWIAARTGIRRRHILGESENLSDHGARAALRALEMAGLRPQDLDLILLATSSPDDLFGSACQVSGCPVNCIGGRRPFARRRR
jgi:3-oxoacyl-[acyl-carrier-protein] synthase III